MGNLRNVGIAEQRVYDDPQNPADSAYDVALPITVPDAVIDPATGKKLSETISEQAAEIVAAKAAAEEASKAAASHTHTASQISGLPTSLPASGGNASTVGGVSVMTTAALGLHKMASGTAAATSSNCPPGAWYGQYE